MLLEKIGLLITLFILASCSNKKQIVIIEERNILEEEIALRADFERNVSNKVYFSFDSSVLSKETQSTIKKQASWLINHPNVGVIIEGHCDEHGTSEYNMALGMRRAVAVQKLLVAQGVGNNRISIISYGKEKPEVNAHNQKAWGLNRRTVTYVTIMVE